MNRILVSFKIYLFSADRVMRQELRPTDSRRGLHQGCNGQYHHHHEEDHQRKRQTEDSGNFANLGDGVQKPVKVPNNQGKMIANIYFCHIFVFYSLSVYF
jgi:hypothetical protein